MSRTHTRHGVVFPCVRGFGPRPNREGIWLWPWAGAHLRVCLVDGWAHASGVPSGVLLPVRLLQRVWTVRPPTLPTHALTRLVRGCPSGWARRDLVIPGGAAVHRPSRRLAGSFRPLQLGGVSPRGRGGAPPTLEDQALLGPGSRAAGQPPWNAAGVGPAFLAAGFGLGSWIEESVPRRTGGPGKGAGGRKNHMTLIVLCSGQAPSPNAHANLWW